MHFRKYSLFTYLSLLHPVQKLCHNEICHEKKKKKKRHRSIHWSERASNANCTWQKCTSDHYCSQIPGNKGQNMAQIPLLSSCTENSWYSEALRLQHVALLKSRRQPWGACFVFQLKSDMHYMWTFGSHIVHHALHIIAWTFTVCSH